MSHYMTCAIKAPTIVHATLAALGIALAGLALVGTAAAMSAQQQAIYDELVAAAQAADPSFAGFSSVRGQAFFRARHTGGREHTRSCSVCHTKDPRNAGQTRAGKAIEPMAVSVSPNRYSDQKKVKKWFRRNCSDVLGRECTALEKGDWLAYMLSR